MRGINRDLYESNPRGNSHNPQNIPATSNPAPCSFRNSIARAPARITKGPQVSSVGGRSLTRDPPEVVKAFHPGGRDLVITRAPLGQIPDANPGVFLVSILLPWRLTLRAQALKLKNVLRL